MFRSTFRIGTPVLLALMIVSIVSLGARLYVDHAMSRPVEAANILR